MLPTVLTDSVDIAVRRTEDENMDEMKNRAAYTMRRRGGHGPESGGRSKEGPRISLLGGFRLEDEGAAIVLDPKGNFAMSYNTEGLYRGYVTSDGKITVLLYDR